MKAYLYRLALVCAPLLAGPAFADCRLDMFAKLPVTLEGMEPMTSAKINGQSVRFLVDSGAFFSVISPGNARVLGLRTEALPGWVMRGINGDAAMSFTTVKTFSISGADLPHVQFVVAGSEVSGVGVLGQNLLGLFDAEYDLPHGMVRLMRPKGCARTSMAYWAQGRDYAVVDMAPPEQDNRQTVGTIYLNGIKMRATFDTGASGSVLTMAAAARAGITPKSPGVEPGGNIVGFGRRLVRTWVAPFASFKVGDGEEIRNGRIRFGDIAGDTDMLLGADFFIAHRVFVANSQRKIYISYEGGPIFNLKTQQRDSQGHLVQAATSAPPASGGGDAESYSRRGALAASRHDGAGAIADFGKAIAIAPDEPRYRVQRATALIARGRDEDLVQARADLDAALALKPADVAALMARAGLLLPRGQDDAARKDLEAASKALAPASDERLDLAGLLTEAGAPAEAVPEFDLWIRLHSQDVRRPNAWNGRCWARALANQDLPGALHDCEAALHYWPHSPLVLDSRAMVELRMGRLDKALADYDAALARSPGRAWSLYGRGVVKIRMGEVAAGKADLAAAAERAPRLAARASALGITP